jgi:arylsulfatase
MAGVSPFKMYKLWPYAGGVRDPLIVSWPGRIRDPGAIRTQHVDVTDITPTVLDILGVQAPTVVDGVPQMEMAGRSILRTIRDPRAPSPHPRQFYVMRGNRYILDGDWKAIAVHTNGTPFEEDRWELYNVANDWTESRNLADRNPAKLRELQALWQSEAARYGALPLVEFRFGGGARRAAPAGGS